MPVENGIPPIETSKSNGKENARPTDDSNLARSPQLYHRRENYTSDATLRTDHTGLQSSGAPDEAVKGHPAARHSFLKPRVKKPYTTSSSDSGTEADDESGVVLKGLPAPPLRWRKGLRQNEGHVTESPLLTPSYFDDDERRRFIECQLRGNPTLQDSALKDEEVLRIRQKYTRRRRAELVRRTSETVLLGVVGYVACGTDSMRLRQIMTPGKALPLLSQYFNLHICRGPKPCGSGLSHLSLIPFQTLISSYVREKQSVTPLELSSHTCSIRSSYPAVSRLPPTIHCLVRSAVISCSTGDESYSQHCLYPTGNTAGPRRLLGIQHIPVDGFSGAVSGISVFGPSCDQQQSSLDSITLPPYSDVAFSSSSSPVSYSWISYDHKSVASRATVAFNGHGELAFVIRISSGVDSAVAALDRRCRGIHALWTRASLGSCPGKDSWLALPSSSSSIT